MVKDRNFGHVYLYIRVRARRDVYSALRVELARSNVLGREEWVEIEESNDGNQARPRAWGRNEKKSLSFTNSSSKTFGLHQHIQGDHGVLGMHFVDSILDFNMNPLYSGPKLLLLKQN